MAAKISKEKGSMALVSGAAFLAAILIFITVAGCAVYEPVPVYRTYPVSSYERIWDSALRATQDAGVRVRDADKDRGVIIGDAGNADVTVNILRQGDGSTRVEFNVKSGETSGEERNRISNDFYRSYERYMGR